MSYIFLFTNLLFHSRKWNCKISEICYFFISIIIKFPKFNNLENLVKFNNLEKLLNTLSVQVILKNNNKK